MSIAVDLAAAILAVTDEEPRGLVVETPARRSAPMSGWSETRTATCSQPAGPTST